MKRRVKELGEKEHDLVVIGGGIFGACIAWDAASRGLKVVLLEKNDFSHATSANHLKMVHGGIRYLQHGDVYRVRESCRERAALLRIAPHLVAPLPILMPTFGRGMRGRAVLGAGVAVYDLLTVDRNRGIPDRARRIPRGRLVSRETFLGEFPGIDATGLTGAALFCDGQMYNPPRLALSFVRAAAEAGAGIANHVEVTGFLRDRNRIAGVLATDLPGGRSIEIRGKVVVNAAGPWAAALLDAGLGVRLKPKPVFSRDVCFIVSSSLSDRYALACQTRTRDADAILSRGSRHLFIAPWRGHTLVGVWHGVYSGSPDRVQVTDEELQVFLDEANAAYPGFSLTRRDVTMVNSGLILFAENRKGGQDISFGKRSLLIDHETAHGKQGLITLIGVRATTARGMAQKAVDLAFRKLGVRPPPCRTETTPIFGGRIDRFEEFLERVAESRPHGLDRDLIEGLVRNYGSEYGAVLGFADGNPDLAGRIAGSDVLRAEVIHAVREEMALTLADVVLRRTDLGTHRHPGYDALRECAHLMAGELGWDDARTSAEIEGLDAELRRHCPASGIGGKSGSGAVVV